MHVTIFHNLFNKMSLLLFILLMDIRFEINSISSDIILLKVQFKKQFYFIKLSYD